MIVKFMNYYWLKYRKGYAVEFVLLLAAIAIRNCLPESVIQFCKQDVVQTPLLVFITITCIGGICVIIYDFKVFSKTEKSAFCKNKRYAKEDS
jgi:hypothetical protein